MLNSYLPVVTISMKWQPCSPACTSSHCLQRSFLLEFIIYGRIFVAKTVQAVPNNLEVTGIFKRKSPRNTSSKGQKIKEVKLQNTSIASQQNCHLCSSCSQFPLNAGIPKETTASTVHQTVMSALPRLCRMAPFHLPSLFYLSMDKNKRQATKINKSTVIICLRFD